jgi:hypothetical protein
VSKEPLEDGKFPDWWVWYIWSLENRYWAHNWPPHIREKVEKATTESAVWILTYEA